MAFVFRLRIAVVVAANALGSYPQWCAGNDERVHRLVTIDSANRQVIQRVNDDVQLAAFHCFVAGRQIVSLEEATGKIRAAVDARNGLDENFVVVARTDARGTASGIASRFCGGLAPGPSSR